MKTKSSEFRAAGKAAGLSGAKLAKFTKFMGKAFPRQNPHSYYTGTWADRFRSGYAYAYADTGNKRILARLGIHGVSKYGVIRDKYGSVKRK